MDGVWTAKVFEGVAFLRQIDSVDTENHLLIIDAPTRYYLKTRDTARVYHASKHITECGIENLSVGNLENPKEGWDEETYNTAGTGAYDVHYSHVILFHFGINCWVKNVHTYKPPMNTQDVHILSNCLSMVQCRFITIDSCDFEKPQYEGGGGNGYMYILESNDCLIKNSRANDGRHNFDFKYPYSNGNVILNCRGENSKYASDFHMYLSMANLFDECTMNGDFMESVFRPYGGDAIHGYSSTQSVFYNTRGEAYHHGNDYIVDSRQFGRGYVIGTSGPASGVKLSPVSGTSNGYSYDTSPEDFLEGQGLGEGLRPVSLYLDQLQRRLDRPASPGKYNVTVILKDKTTDEPLSGSEIMIYSDKKNTDGNGSANFTSVYESFILTIKKDLYQPVEKKQVVIYSDTTLTFFLDKKDCNVTFTLLDDLSREPIRDVEISMGDDYKTTDGQGKATFTVKAGTNTYSIKKHSFKPEEGNLDILSDTAFTFLLIRTEASVRFSLKDSTLPIENAIVKINDDSLNTNTQGIADFSSLPVNTDYHFTIRKEDYYTIEDDLHLVTDTTLDITMDALPSGLADAHTVGSMFLWPNPASDILYGFLSLNIRGNTIRIVDRNGKEMMVRSIEQDSFSLNIKGLSPGVYFLQVTGKDALHLSRRFVKMP